MRRNVQLVNNRTIFYIKEISPSRITPNSLTKFTKMNHHFFISSIILLFFILTQFITIDAHYKNVCVVTKVIPTTITVANCSSTPTKTYKPLEHSCEKKKHYKTTKTVTCTPTVTHCATCCEIPGAPGWDNIIRPGGGSLSTSDQTAQACCRSCMDNPNCAQWAFIGSACIQNVGQTCVGSRINFTSDSGIIRCTGEGCSVPQCSGAGCPPLPKLDKPEFCKPLP